MSIQSTGSSELPSRLTHRTAALVEIDIRQCTQIFKEINDADRFVLFIDGFYSLCSGVTVNCGGEIVKYMGDSCLAIFDETDCIAAVDSVLKVRAAFPDYCRKFGVTPTDIRATVHTGEVVYGTFGPEGMRDVIGKTASELFQMIGSGITITEQVYRKLPSANRGPWKKHGGQVTYILK
jgi:class 3 adenylate cyclase